MTVFSSMELLRPCGTLNFAPRGRAILWARATELLKGQSPLQRAQQALALGFGVVGPLPGQGGRKADYPRGGPQGQWNGYFRALAGTRDSMGGSGRRSMPVTAVNGGGMLRASSGSRTAASGTTSGIR